MSAKNMQIVDVEQRSKSWFDLRKTKVSATDACAIMGCGFKTISQLYEEKVSDKYFEPAINAAMERGIVLEPIALKLFEMQHDIEMFPRVCVRDWQMASMDGLSGDLKTAVEIKCPGIKTHSIAKSGSIPDYYKPQLQHQMYVLDLDSMFYFSFFEGDGVTLEIARDDNYIADMIEQETEFYECLQNRTPPIAYVERNDNEWSNTAHAYRLAKEQLQVAERREQDLKRQIMLMAGTDNVKGAGLVVRQVERKGNINYSKIPELQGVDLEKYRCASSKYVRIS